MGKTQSEINPEEKKNSFSIIFFVIGKLLKWMFPAYPLLYVNTLCAKAGKIFKHVWFPQQVRRNWLVILLVTSLFLGPLGLGFLAIRGNQTFQDRVKNVSKYVEKRELKLAGKYLSYALEEPKFVFVIKFMGSCALLGLILGNVLISHHFILVNSKMMEEVAKKEGIIDKDNPHPIVLYTPIGILINLDAGTPKEIIANERIWTKMNIQVKDWVEDPKKRSLVFFKISFKLKDKYEYILPENFK